MLLLTLFLYVFATGSFALKLSNIQQKHGLHFTQQENNNGSLNKRDYDPVEAAIVEAVAKTHINSSATNLFVNSLTNITDNKTHPLIQRYEKRDMVWYNWIGVALFGLSEVGISVGGLVPLCQTNRAQEFFGSTWRCVTLGISIIMLYNGAYLAGIDATVMDVERIASVGLMPEKRDSVNTSALWTNHTDAVASAASSGLGVAFLTHEGAFLGNDGHVYLHKPLYTFSLNGSPVLNHFRHSGAVYNFIDDFKHTEDSSSKRDYIGTDMYNTVSFSKGGILTQSCHYQCSAEALTAPDDLQMLYDVFNDKMAGYWYYHHDKHEYYIKDKNHQDVDIDEGIMQFHDSAFATEEFMPPWDLCKSKWDDGQRWS